MTEKLFRSTSINCVITVKHHAAFDELLFLYMLHIERLFNQHLSHAISELLNFVWNIKAFFSVRINGNYGKEFLALFSQTGALNNSEAHKTPSEAWKKLPDE